MTKMLRRQQPRRSLLETFLQLCSMTTPDGCESYCWPLLPKGKDIDWNIDINNNVHIYVYDRDKNGRLTDSRIMWTAHLDTADSFPEHVKFKRTIDKAGDEIIETDGTTILGADCKIGVAIMIKMIEARIPGWYAFFTGEESGRIGSDALARRFVKRITDGDELILPDICISFDRYGIDDIITHQMGRRTASHTFALALASIFNKHPEFNYVPSSHGSYTDSYSFCGLIPECTNISVGYNSQHTHYEEQNITHAQHLLDIILDQRELFESLPADRDPHVQEHKTSIGLGFNMWQGRHDYQHNNQHYGDMRTAGHVNYSSGSTTPNPTNAGTTSALTVLPAHQSGTVGPHSQESLIQSGKPSDINGGINGKTTPLSSPHKKARRMTKAEKKAAKRLRKAEMKAERKVKTLLTGRAGYKVIRHKSSANSSDGKKKNDLLSQNKNSAADSTSGKGVESFPFRCKSEKEVMEVMEVTDRKTVRYYQGYLDLMRDTVHTSGGSSSSTHSTRRWLDEPIGDFPHGGINLGDYTPSTCDGHDHTFDADRTCAALDTFDDTGDMLEDGLFDEMEMLYEKGELTHEEENEYLIQHLKRAETRGLTPVHRHGQLVTWHKCNNCETIQKDNDWFNPNDPPICEDCGDPIERITHRYDSDLKLYVPLTGDITDAIPPHLLP